MKKLYKNSLVALASMFATAGYGQTEIVKDYYPPEKGFGVAPISITSNSELMVFSGAADALVSPFFGTTPLREPFVTDGTGDVFLELDLNTIINRGAKAASSPSNFFVFNEEIYFTATNDTVDALYKINDLSGTADFVTSKWTPSYQPQVLMSGFPASEKVLMVGKNPLNSEDENYYLLEWNGVDSLPKMKNGQTSMFGAPLYNLKGSTDFCYIGGISNFAVFAASNPSDDTGVEVCVYYSNFRGASAVFTDINPGTKEVGGVDYQNDGSPEDFTNIDNVIYFNSAQTNEVWKVDLAGGETTAVKVEAINKAVNQNTIVKMLASYKGKLVFSGVAKTAEDSTSTSPVNIFTYDPETEAVEPLITSADMEIRDPHSCIVYNDTLYFSGNTRSIPYDVANNASPLYRYDGTELVNLTPGLKSVSGMHVFKDKIYFSAKDDKGIDKGDGTYSSTLDELFVYDPSATSVNTAVRKITVNNALHVWPNPSSGVVNIDGNEIENGDYSIYDLNGKLMEKGSYNGNQIRYNVSKGSYVLQVTTQQQNQVIKIMVE